MRYKIAFSDELYHHGIKGQRWGIRRYQNEDGSLTDAGREHYYPESESKAQKANLSPQKVAKVALAVGAAAAGTALTVYGVKKVRELNTEAIEGLQKKYADLTEEFYDKEMGKRAQANHYLDKVKEAKENRNLFNLKKNTKEINANQKNYEMANTEANEFSIKGTAAYNKARQEDYEFAEKLNYIIKRKKTR